MSKTRFQRVPFDKDEPETGALIRIFRRGGKVLATVTRYEWFDPDGNEFTRYADIVETNPALASGVLTEFRKHGCQVALESDDLWDPAWGDLR